MSIRLYTYSDISKMTSLINERPYWTKMVPITKCKVRREKISYKERNHSCWKNFHVKSDKKQNIFLHTRFKISWNFDITHLHWSKTDLCKEQKKKKKRDTLRISVAVIQRFNVKKKSLSLKFGCNLCISVKIVISEQIILAAIFYRVGMLSTNN